MAGPRSSVRFALRDLLDSARITVNDFADAIDHQRALARKEYRFPILGMPDIRLPKDVSALSQWLTGREGAAGYAVLKSPTFLVPLRSDESGRGVALIGAISDDPGPTVVVARLSVASGTTRFAPRAISACSVQLATGREAIAELLEQVWFDADPIAQSQGEGSVALWLSPGLTQPEGERRVSAIGAVYGYQLEFFRDADRHVKQVRARLGSAPPAAVAIWQPHGHGYDSALRSYREASAEGEILDLTEPDFDDALLELRWALADLSSFDESAVAVADGDVPQPGDERFYIKVGGSGVGDVMKEVADCGHGQWGSDQRRKAPRADKGLGASVGRRPKTLYLCAICKKHRWRARF